MDMVKEQWSRTSVWARTATLVGLPISGYLAARLRADYYGWLALGPGGISHSPLGYCVNLLLTVTMARRDTKSTSIYDRPEKYAVGWKEASGEEKAKAKQSFLDKPLPQRKGPVANAKPYTAPQRERDADEGVDEDIKKTYLSTFEDLGKENADGIEWKTSVLERRGQAMFLTKAYRLPTLIAKCSGEVAHIHESDMTAHVLLSLADAREVVEKGWGERHRLSGVMIPSGYTMLYVPRDQNEVADMIRVLGAGVEYAKSSGKVR